MAQPVVLITFYCRSGDTETLALSHAVGAVQGRALIRLRRLADVEATVVGSGDEGGAEVRRMLKDYVEPTEKDLLGADAIAVVPPPGATPSSEEWAAYLALLTRLGAEGKLEGKVGAIVDTGDAGTVAAFAAALLSLGLTVVPPAQGAHADPAAATSHGRRVAMFARGIKA